MVRQATIDKVINFLKNVKKSKLSVSKYCKENGFSSSYWYKAINKAISNPKVAELYNNINTVKKNIIPESDTNLAFEDIAKDVEWVKDSNDIIIGYKFNIKRKAGGPLIGSFSRSQMDTLCSLYSRYGADLTIAQTSLDFPEYSLDELQRIKRAFLIYKYSCPFAPHEIDEHTEEELHNIAIERKRNNLTRTLEKNQLRDAQKINLQLVEENKKLRDFEEYLSNIKIDISGLPKITPEVIPSKDNDYDNSLILNLSDLHVGAKVISTALYDNLWTEPEINKRLYAIIKKVDNLKSILSINTIYVNLLGDMLDGMDNQTARRDHYMPQCMDNYEQFNVFFRQMSWFIGMLAQMFNKIHVHSVPNGNHTGAPEYFAVTALKAALSNISNLDMVVSDKFISYYTIEDRCIITVHGKDADFMKKPLPLRLDPNSIVWLNNYMDRSGITKQFKPGKIHIYKGDLHSAAYDSNLKFDYRNCLSLFGDSDYSQMNFNSNPRGCSYSLIMNDNMINGEFIID